MTHIALDAVRNRSDSTGVLESASGCGNSQQSQALYHLLLLRSGSCRNLLPRRTVLHSNAFYFKYSTHARVSAALTW